jgi:hypothetical protein
VSRFVRIAFAAAVVAAHALAGCASTAPAACRDGEPAVSDLLYFGTAKPGGVVGPGEWSDFLRDVVTPRFPAGLTAWRAAGQWRSAGGSVDREASYVVSLVHPDDAASEESVRSIVAAYKSRFRQEAVLRVTTRACASF